MMGDKQFNERIDALNKGFDDAVKGGELEFDEANLKSVSDSFDKKLLKISAEKRRDKFEALGIEGATVNDLTSADIAKIWKAAEIGTTSVTKQIVQQFTPDEIEAAAAAIERAKQEYMVLKWGKLSEMVDPEIMESMEPNGF